MKTFLLNICLASLLFTAVANAENLDVLIREKAAETYGATLPDSGDFNIIFQTATIQEAVLVSAFWMDTNTSQFIANVIPQDGIVRRVGGLAVLTVQVPVPVRRMLPDAIISEQDIMIQRLPYSRVGAYAVTTAKDVIGKQVRRLLTKGRPIMTQSIMHQRIIDRGDIVEIQYIDGKLRVSAPGRALSDAYRGQEIKIVNLIGNKTVLGIATNDGLVEIIR
ncbi:MAG: flagella basal body P-ring formation protein FlgA [Rhodobacteraceae bacterium]|nr:MAG: flagella basal body P-ring formation protein FlgA [Paracoccaceae bacterium]